MERKDFCHLHVHTEYSQLDGFGSAKNYLQKAIKNGQEYLACTDHGNIDGLIKFQQECERVNIKPVLGCELYIVKEWSKDAKNGHITVWIKNKTGFKNLCKILTVSNLKGFYYKPRVNFDTFLKHCNGLVVGTACVSTFYKIDGGEDFFYKLKKKIKDDLYIEVMPHNIKIQKKRNKEMLQLAKRTKTKVIVTNDCHYIEKKDHKVQEVLLAIQRKVKWDDPKRWSFGFTGLHLRKTSEMIKTMKKESIYKKEYLLNTIEVAEKCCNFRIEKRKIRLPKVPNIPKDENKFLLKLCKEGFEKKFNKKIIREKVYFNRLKEEFDLIVKKNFTRYFLIVWELCNWCRKEEILIGPGRGSVGGSLIAFLLNITTVDPIKHELIFSRFINQDRIDYPDIDLDFEDVKRHLIKEHLEELYGSKNVAGISSFNRLKSKNAVQNVARVFSVPVQEVNNFTKMIDEEIEGVESKIEAAIIKYEECKNFAVKYPKVIKYSIKLEGQVYGYSQHAAALVVSKKALDKSGRCVIIERKGVKLINWEKDDTEYVGLMKLDALGLKLLSVLSHVKKLIKENYDKNIDFSSLELENKRVLSEISNGNTIGAFQINTYAMTSLIKEMGISTFRHIVDAIALVRPGPMYSGMTKNYIKRKHGSSWKKLHKNYEELTKDTYGLIVFQEQVMSVINKVAGLPYSTADKIRKIIGKKRSVKEFEVYKKKFKDGCKKTKIFTEREAKQFWEGLQEWASYGFNKAHSVEYSILAVWCIWLKCFYPSEFICGALTHATKDKKKELVKEAYRLGLNIITPKVGINDAFDWIAKDKTLYIPFKEIKSFGDVKALDASKRIIKNTGIKGFFKSSKKQKEEKHSGKMGEILEKIKAYDVNDNEITEEIESFFDFELISDPKEKYKNLYKLFDGIIRANDLDKILNGEKRCLKRIEKRFYKTSFENYSYDELKENFSSCEKCSLNKNCRLPLFPQSGKFNIMVITETPTIKEIRYLEHLKDNIWDSFKKKIKRRTSFEVKEFHVTKINKCLAKNKKASKKELQKCSEYLIDEIKQINPLLIFTTGNNSIQFFLNQNNGILKYNGTTVWNELYGCFVCFAINPSSIIYSEDNEILFNKGVDNFVKLLRIFSR